jgi:hypothetical protein
MEEKLREDMIKREEERVVKMMKDIEIEIVKFKPNPDDYKN